MYVINAKATHCKDFNYVKLSKAILVLCNFMEEEPSLTSTFFKEMFSHRANCRLKSCREQVISVKRLTVLLLITFKIKHLFLKINVTLITSNVQSGISCDINNTF